MHFSQVATATAMLTFLICPASAFAQNPEPARHDGVTAQFDPDDFVPLGAQPAAQFAEMPVEAASGARIGTVRSVGLAPDGSAARVLVDLYSGGSVWIVADALRYNRNAGILLTNLKHIESSADRGPF
jgi:hypothetical protein